MIQKLLVAATVVVFSCVAAPAFAQFGEGNTANPMFQQYTAGGAGMYPAPHYSPDLGSHSSYTYQPLMPHEMMYQHSRNYYNYYNSGGYMGGNDSLNVTKVRWQSGTNHMGPIPLTTGIDSLIYKINQKKYGLDGGGAGGGHFGGGGGHFSGGGGHFGGGGHLRSGKLRGRLHGGHAATAGCSTCGY